jgi:hypothetical protein
MSGISRRATFGAALYAFPLSSVPIVAKAYGIDHDAMRLAERMGELHGGQWRAVVDHDAGFILIKPRPRPNPKPLVSS